MSSVPARCWGWLAITPTVRPSSRARPMTRLGAWSGRSSRNESWSTTSSMTPRTSYDAVAAGGNRDRGPVTVAVDRVVARDDRRVVEMVRRQVVEEGREWRRRRRPRRRRPGRRPRCAAVERGAAEARWSTSTPVKSATVSGPLTYANASLVITTTSTSPRQQRGAGHARAGDREDRRDDAGRPRERMGHPPQACSDATPSRDVGTRGVDHPDERNPELGGQPDGPFHGCARRGADRAVCLPPSMRNQLTVRPSISRSCAVTMSLRRPASGVGAAPMLNRSRSAPTWRCGRRTRTSSTARRRGPI